MFGAPFEFTDCVAGTNKDMFVDIASQDPTDDDDETQDIQRMEMDMCVQVCVLLWECVLYMTINMFT